MIQEEGIMFVWSFKMNKRELIIAAAGMVIFIVLALLLIARGGAFGGGKEREEAVRASAGTASEREAYLTSLGWEIERTPLEVREIAIPAEFDEKMTEYAALQRSQGFDFEALSGERVRMYAYRVTNYPAADGRAVAELLVRGGKVVGGDIYPAAEKEAIQGLDPVKFGKAAADVQRRLAEKAIDRSVPDAIPADSDALPEPDSEGEW